MIDEILNAVLFLLLGLQVLTIPASPRLSGAAFAGHSNCAAGSLRVGGGPDRGDESAGGWLEV